MIEEIKPITWMNKSGGNQFQSLPKMNICTFFINEYGPC